MTLKWFVCVCVCGFVISYCLFSLSLRENGRNNSQHCWANNVGSCCVRVGTGVQTDATTPNNVETCSATSEEYNQWDFVSKPCEWPKQCRKRCAIGSNIVPLPFGNRGTKEMLGVVGLKVWPGVNSIKLLHLYVFQLYTVHVKSHLWIHGFN